MQSAKFKVQNDLKEKGKQKVDLSSVGAVMTFEDLAATDLPRIFAGTELGKTLYPQGIPVGSLTLLAGEPGAGKSTLALQLALDFARENKVIYFSAEESGSQVKEKLGRLGVPAESFLFSAEKKVETVGATISHHEVKVAVIDSIQTIHTEESDSEASPPRLAFARRREAGSIQQLKICTTKLLEIAKENQVAIIVIGHVTKEGVAAGPKTLEHLVDIVMYIEGDPDSRFRMLRSTKNRYGSSGKVSVLHMTDKGLQVVKQAATAFVANFQPKVGSVLTAIVDSGQVFFLEVQSLVTSSNFGYAKRTTSGFPVKRLEVLLAVMKKRLNLDFDRFDVYVNLVGGFKVSDPAMDLAVVLSLISSLKNKVLSGSTVVFGEVGLAGELRAVKETGMRLESAAKHNYKQIILPPVSARSASLKLQACESLDKVMEILGWQ
ncbi:MAG: ATPase domain-containing protein [Candidatus Komeilibacteria bacterium]